jgi:hypothetical protein
VVHLAIAITWSRSNELKSTRIRLVAMVLSSPFTSSTMISLPNKKLLLNVLQQ